MTNATHTLSTSTSENTMSNHAAASTTPTLAIALIVKNEGAILEACLESVKDLADEIIILDSGSTDNTEAIARRYTDKFYVNTPWPGFGAQRQVAQRYVTADWVLWLDADEHVTAELATSIRQVLANPPIQTIFAVSRLTWAFGQFIRHCGWYPGYVERLYPTALTHYNDALVHESVRIPVGVNVEKLAGDLLHYTYRDLHSYLLKSAQYANAWAMQRHAQGKKKGMLTATLHGVARFVRTYILKAGFLDGRAGFLLSVLAAQSVFNKYTALALMHRAEQEKEPFPRP